MRAPEARPDRGRTVAARLRSAQQRVFVGRQAELELLRAALAEDPPPFAVLHLYGPGGVGKSALLDRFAALAEAAGRPVTRLDGRELDRAPDALQRAFLGAGGGAGGVLLVDAYEALAPVDGWLREVVLPQLDARAVVVLAGRDPPACAWRTDAGWRELFRSVALDNLPPEESRALLERRGVPPGRAAAAVAFTHGHPLALTLVADVLSQGGVGLTSERSMDVVRTLVQRFTQGVPSPLHRQALEVCAHARVTTEALLEAAVGPAQAHALFDWLASLSFVECGPHGLHPHDLAREALDEDLRWRNPEGYAALHHRVRAHVLAGIAAASGLRARQRAFAGLLFLHRHNAVSRPVLRFYELGRVAAEPARAEELPALHALTARLHGPEAAARVARWLERQPEGAWVIVDGPRRPAGFFLEVALQRASAEDLATDPVARAAWEHVRRHAPLREGEEARLGRFWLDGERGRELLTPAMEVTAILSGLYWIGTPGLAWSLVSAEAGPLGAFLEHCDFGRAPGRELVEDGRAYALFAHDWRVRPPAAWLALMGDREIALDDDAPPARAPAARGPVVLSQAEYADAVRHALRDLHRPGALAMSPLLRCRVVLDRTDPGDPVASLRAAVREAVEELRADPRAEKAYRAVHRTYLEPAPTQERAAELLRLPFSTYRRQLGVGVERVVESLWRRELHGAGPAAPASIPGQRSSIDRA